MSDCEKISAFRLAFTKLFEERRHYSLRSTQSAHNLLSSVSFATRFTLDDKLHQVNSHSLERSKSNQFMGTRNQTAF